MVWRRSATIAESTERASRSCSKALAAPLTMPAPDAEAVASPDHQAVLDALAGGGAFFFRRLSDALGSTDDQLFKTSDTVAYPSGDFGVNIESLETRLSPAPYTGSPVFEMEAVLAVPRSTPINRLRQKLGEACDGMNMDWELSGV